MLTIARTAVANKGKMTRELGAIQFGGEFLITAEITENTERKNKNLSVLGGLRGKFLPDEKDPPPF
jgi:hypothetical protein